jgi:hypothetical protein
MNIDAPRLAAGHPDRDIHCQESFSRVMQQIIADATMQGWGTIETINAIEEILKNIRVAYDEDPDPQNPPSEIG